MRRNKFLAGCITVPSAVCAQILSHSVTSSADDSIVVSKGELLSRILKDPLVNLWSIFSYY